MDRLSHPMFVQGYTAALREVLDTIEGIQDDLKRHKRKQNSKTYTSIVRCMIESRTILREDPYAFIRCNDKAKGGFEVFRRR